MIFVKINNNVNEIIEQFWKINFNLILAYMFKSRNFVEEHEVKF